MLKVMDQLIIYHVSKVATCLLLVAYLWHCQDAKGGGGAPPPAESGAAASSRSGSVNKP